jgi:hypothetical protein
MLFNFALIPLDDIRPWGEPGNLSLSWFGLTDGAYWIQAGGSTLFEYSEYARQRLGAPRFCEYQVARLYEDIVEMVPYVLEPVPAALVPYISGDCDHARASRDTWFEANANRNDDHYWETVESGENWLRVRTLDSAYLSPSATIRLWSDESNVHLEWDNRNKLVEGGHAWSAVIGSHSLPRGEFIRDVRSFHACLMEAMRERAYQVGRGALPNEVRVDLPGLQREHEKRCLLSESLFAAPIVATDWRAVCDALSEFERAR